VQLARELGAEVIAAGRSVERLRELEALGIERRVLLDAEFVGAVHRRTNGRGVDLVLDLVGGEWTAKAIDALAPHGRLVLVGLTAGAKAHVDLAHVLRRSLRIVGSLLRTRSREEKASLVSAFQTFAGTKLATGAMKPIVHRTFPLAKAAAAYEAMAAGGFTGKLVLTP
jgi:NADPH2:quinone reductase